MATDSKNREPARLNPRAAARAIAALMAAAILGQAAAARCEDPEPAIAALARLAPLVTPMALGFDASGPRLTIQVIGEWHVGQRRSDLAETRVDLKEINPDGIELMKSPFVLPGAGPVIDRFLKVACQRLKRCVEFGPVDRSTGKFIGSPDRHDSVVIDVMAEARFEDLDAFVKALQGLVLPHVQ